MIDEGDARNPPPPPRKSRALGRRSLIVGLGAAAGLGGLIALRPEQPSTTGQPSEEPVHDKHASLARVDDYRSDDGFDSTRIQRAVDDAVRQGLGGVQFSARTYELNVPVSIPPVSGFLLRGTPGATTLKRSARGRTVTAFKVEGVSGDHHADIQFRGLTFNGGLANLGELGTARARGAGDSLSDSTGEAEVRWSAGKLSTAISINGDRAHLQKDSRPEANPYGTVANISVVECTFVGMQGLPVHFRGVSGGSVVRNCLFVRCLDPGWVYCEVAHFSDNRSDYSMDNGASISRGCERAIVTGNFIRGAWFSGIMVGGFEPDSFLGGTLTPQAALGPLSATVADNIIEHCGEYGIAATGSGGRLTIVGNVVSDIAPTATSGPLSRSQGVGIVVSEWSEEVRPRSVSITGNSISAAARGGIIVHRAHSASITGNDLIAIGTPQFPDGDSRDGAPGMQAFGISHGGLERSLQDAAVVVTGNSITASSEVQASDFTPIYFPPGGRQLILNNLT